MEKNIPMIEKNIWINKNNLLIDWMDRIVCYNRPLLSNKWTISFTVTDCSFSVNWAVSYNKWTARFYLIIHLNASIYFIQFSYIFCFLFLHIPNNLCTSFGQVFYIIRRTLIDVLWFQSSYLRTWSTSWNVITCSTGLSSTSSCLMISFNVASPCLPSASNRAYTCLGRMEMLGFCVVSQFWICG